MRRVGQEPVAPPAGAHFFLPVLPLPDACLFPEASLTVSLANPAAAKAVDLATRTGGRLLAVAPREAGSRVLQTLGTVAGVVLSSPPETATQAELDGLFRARTVTLVGVEALVAEVEPLQEGDPGDEWGAAVEALARYLHAHADLRAFLDRQRRSQEPMAWVNLACQHLPITVTARQKLLECGAAERCLKISRGLDALLRKEQGA